MSGKSNWWANGLLNCLFNGAALAGVIQNVDSGAYTEWWLSLHTADPGAAGNQSTSEATYPGYARVAVARDTTGWPTTSDDTITLGAITAFPTATGGSQTVSYFGIGTAATGAGQLLYTGTLDPTVAVSDGVTVRLLTDTSVTES